MTSDETIACRWSIESRTRLSFAGDPPVQINKKPEIVGNVWIFLIAVIPFPICHLWDFYAVAVITLKNRNYFIISLFNQVHLLI